jgi:aconitate hydratase
VESEPSRYFDRVIDLDLSALEPQVAGPTRPDLVRSIGRLADEAGEGSFPIEITNALIGSCTNSSYEDIGLAAQVARQANVAGAHVKVPLLITPGSHRALATLRRDGLLADLEAIGATVLSSACGPCIGQWRRTDDAAGTSNSIISSFNRNFPRRNDGSAQTYSFLASPTTVVLAALAGRLDFDPRTDTLDGVLKFEPPSARALPERGWEGGDHGFVAPPPPGQQIDITVDPHSSRLQVIGRFAARRESDFTNMPVLLKIDGRCTTDHISPAGAWLQLRGHLERLSENIFLNSSNAFTDADGMGVDQLDGAIRPFPAIAKRYRERGLGWVVVGGDNYGEGSSREHAAMSPRFMGASVVLARSFARIHEANLKRQAVLALTFDDPANHESICEDARIDVVDPRSIAPGEPVRLRIHQRLGTSEIAAQHTMNWEQIHWLWAGSALNAQASRNIAEKTSGEASS